MIRGGIIAPNGMSYYIDAISICGEPIGALLFNPSPDIYIYSKWWFTKKYQCGHRGPLKFDLFVYGKVVRPAKGYEHCPDCCIKELRETVIRCASCEVPIFPATPASLCHPTTTGLNLAIANFISNNAVVTCMKCNPNFAGHWTREGFSPYPFENDK